MINLKSWQKTYNFGDMLSTPIVEFISGGQTKLVPLDFKEGALLALGSLSPYAYNSDIVWGTGVRLPHIECKDKPKIYAVRGPLSAKWFGWDGKIYGDPAILLPLIFNFDIPKKHKYGYIRHASEKAMKCDCFTINIKNKDYLAVLKDILSCEVIITSALHPLIVADVYDIPVIPIKHQSNSEPNFKYDDYFIYSNREYKPAKVTDVIDIPDLVKYQIKPYWNKSDVNRLIEYFPKEYLS